jgi:RNA polymerase sigma factor (TIGR02999 family)
MMSVSKHRVTELLADLQAGDGEAAEPLFEAVYDELRRLARGKREQWKGDPSLQTTALAHEAYVKLVGDEERSWENRSHFFAVAAQALRQILVNRARRKHAQKRGGEAPVLSLEELRETVNPEADEAADHKVTTAEEAQLLVLLDEALGRFADEYPRAARGVECRFFGGMTIEETAEALGVSASTISRDWSLAKAWLYREMKRMRGGEPDTEPDS